MSTLLEPDYSQLRQVIEDMSGQRLPGERELADRLQISRSRLRQVLAVLEREGKVERRQGSGTYVVNPQRSAPGDAFLLIDAALKLGEDPFFSLLVERLQGELQDAGWRCLVERIQESNLRHPAGEGWITLGLAGKQILQSHRPGDTPVIAMLLDAAPGPGASVLQLEDRQAGAVAARRLIERNCTNLLFVGRRSIPMVQNRLAGVQQAAIDQESAAIEVAIVDCPLHYTAGLEVARNIALPEGAPLGIIAANDWLAVGLHAGLAARGAAPPAFHLVSFDGLSITADPELEIDSLAVPVQLLAQDAVAELTRLRRPGASGRTLLYPLSWRSSSLRT